MGATGLYILFYLRVLEMSRVWIISTFLSPKLPEALCLSLATLSADDPTTLTNLASGRLDALVTMAGIGSWPLLCSPLYLWLEGFYKTGYMGYSHS